MKHSSLFIIALMLLGTSEVRLQVKFVPRASSALGKSILFQWKTLDANRIRTTVGSDGLFVDYRKTGTSGLEWPKELSTFAVFSAGFWIGGIHRPSGGVRASIMEYESEFQPGPLLEVFNTSTNYDSLPVLRSSDPKYRIYKISRSDTVNPSLNPDYLEWPVDLGAPFIDRNGNGTWEPGTDIPKFYGEQQMWMVINDASNRRDQSFTGGGPMGIEVRCLYHTIDGMLDAIGMRWTVINRSDADYDSVFTAIWSDTDVGNATDDLPGSDSLRGMMYLYNGDEFDDGTGGYGSAPPAVGYVYLQTPIQTSGAHDSAYAAGVWRQGYRNVPPSSSVVIFTSSWMLDPPFYISPDKMYGVMNGKDYWTDKYRYASDDRIYKWYLSGDPVAGTGDLPWNFPGGNLPPADYRGTLNCGPFALARGDTQEIAAALIIARGTNRLNSIVELKNHVDLLKSVYPALLPREPRATATIETEDTLAKVFVTVDVRESAGDDFIVSLSDIGGPPKISTKLHDNGIDDNGIAGDRIFGATLSVPTQVKPLSVNVTAKDVNPARWDGLLTLTTADIEVLGPFLVAENLRNDSIANPGERIRYTVGLRNPNRFALEGTAITVNTNRAILPPSPDFVLDPGESDTLKYSPGNTKTYFELFIPDTVRSESYSHNIWVSDISRNSWRRTVTFPVA